MKSLYPPLTPYHTFFLKTGSIHEVYVEESGNPDGIPVIFLHGGPCSGSKPVQRQFFNPKLYRIILFDQRGCGLSRPFGEIANNTTQDLCADIERIRQQLNIKRWLLFGGSWGATLAFLYAQKNPAQVAGMIIRGIFLARKQDLDWYIKEDGVARIYPEQWQRLADSVPPMSRTNMIEALYHALQGEDEITRRRVAKEWAAWSSQVTLGNDFAPSPGIHVNERMVKQARMELHYAQHHYFIQDHQILDHCYKLPKIPIQIIHGRLDLVCPIESALKLHQALPQAEFTILPKAGHIAYHPDMINALIAATDQFAETSNPLVV
jgi:proline iminopeptidase